MRIMTAQNDNEGKQLTFPIQRTEPGDHNSDDQLYTNVVMKYTGYLNEVAAGTRELTDELKQDILELNTIFARSNYPLICVDF